MNLFDCLLMAILAYSTIVAFVRGIILELFSLGGLIVGILAVSIGLSLVFPVSRATKGAD